MNRKLLTIGVVKMRKIKGFLFLLTLILGVWGCINKKITTDFSVNSGNSKDGCSKLTINLNENTGLWGDKASLREYMTEVQWQRFLSKLEQKGINSECKKQIIEAASRSNYKEPIPLELVTVATEVFIEDLSK